MKTVLRKLFGASAGAGAMGGFFVLALAGLISGFPSTAHAAREDWVGWRKVEPIARDTTEVISYAGVNPFMAAGQSFAIRGSVTLNSGATFTDGKCGVAMELQFQNDPRASIVLVKRAGAQAAFQLSSAGSISPSSPPAAKGGTVPAVAGKRYELMMEFDAPRNVVRAWVNGESLGEAAGVCQNGTGVHNVLWGTKGNDGARLNEVVSSYTMGKDEAVAVRPGGVLVKARYVRFSTLRMQTPSETTDTGKNEEQYGTAISEFRLSRGDQEVMPSGLAVIDATASSRSGADDPNRLKDGSYGSNKFWTAPADGALHFTYDLGTEQFFDGYMVALADARYRHPIAWRVEVSSDNATWRVWDVQDYGSTANVPKANATMFVKPTEEEPPEGKVPKAWRYVRYTATKKAGDGLALGQVNLLHNGAPVLPPSGISVTGSGSVSDSTSVNNIADGTFSTSSTKKKYWTWAGTPEFTLDLGREMAFEGYRLQLADHGPRNPVAWKVEVSNDKDTWELFDEQDFGDVGTASGYFGTTGSATNVNSAGLYGWRDFAGAVVWEDAADATPEPRLTGRSVNFVLGACGSLGADLTGSTLYGIAPYQVPGSGWNNLAPTSNSKGSSFTHAAVKDNGGNTISDASFAVNKHGEVNSITLKTDGRSDTGTTADYCLLPAGAGKMAAFRTNGDGEDSFVFTGVPYKKFAVVLYIGAGGAAATGHDYVTVTKTLDRGKSTSVKYTYRNGKLTYVDGTLIPDGNHNVGVWGNPEISWNNTVGDGVMVLPNQTPDKDGKFTFRISQKNNLGGGVSWRSMFRAVQFVELADDWHEPLRKERGSVGFVVGSSVVPSPLSASGWYGLNGFALAGGKWNVMLLERNKSLTLDTVRDATGATVEGMTLESAAFNGNLFRMDDLYTELILPALTYKTPRPEGKAKFTVKGVPYKRYSVLVYVDHTYSAHDAAHTRRTATKPIKFTTADGTAKTYTYDAFGNLVEGTGDWGKFGINYVSSAGVEGLGVMRIPGVTGENFIVEATSNQSASQVTDCQILGVQIVEEAAEDRVLREGVRMLHRFDFEETMTVSGKTRVAPLDKGAGGHAFPVITDAGSNDTIPGEARFGSGGLISGVGVGGLASSTNSDGLRLRNTMGLGCGAEKGFTLSAFLKNVESANGKGPLSITLGKVGEPDNKSFTVQFQKWGSSPSFTLGGFWAGSSSELSAKWKTTTQAPPFPVGQWGHYAVTVRPLATSEKANDGEPCVTLDFFYNGERYGTCAFDGNRGNNKVSMRELVLKEVIIGRSRRSTTPSDANNNLNSETERNPKTVHLDEVALFDRVISDEGIAWLSEHEAAVPPSETAMTEWGIIPAVCNGLNQGNWAYFQVRFGGSGVRHVGAQAPVAAPETAELRGATVRWHEKGTVNINVRRLVLVDAQGKVAACSGLIQTFAYANNHCSTYFPFPEGSEVSFTEDYKGYFIGDYALPIGSDFDESLKVNARYTTYSGGTQEGGFYVKGSNGALQASDAPAIGFTFYHPAEEVTMANGASISVNFDTKADRLAADEAYGLVPTFGSAWSTITALNTPTAITDSRGRTGVTVSASASKFEEMGGGFYHPLLRGTLMDNGSNVNLVSVSLAGIPYETYDAYVYMTANAWPYNGPIYLNGDKSAYYYHPAGAAVASASATPVAWGKTSEADAAAQAEPTLGVNVMRIADLSGASLTLTSHRFGGNARGVITAVQIVERKNALASAWRGTVGANDTSATLTVTSEDGTQVAKLRDLTEGDSVTLTADVAATLTMDYPQTLAALTVKGVGSLTLKGQPLLVTEAAGVTSGTLFVEDGALRGDVGIATGATLGFSGAAAQTFVGRVSGQGTVRVAAGADVTLTNVASDWLGGADVLGTLRFGGTGSLGSGAVTVRAGGVFDLNGYPCAQAVVLDGGTLANTEPPLVASLNLNSGGGKLGTSDVGGLVPMRGEYWTNVTATSGSTPLNFVEQPSIAVSGASKRQEGAISWSASHWSRGTNTTAFMKGYLDDGSSDFGKYATLTLPPALAARAYDVYYYSNTDYGNGYDRGQFAYHAISEDDGATLYYTYVDGALAEGTTAWGDIATGVSTLAEGVNVMVLRDRTAESLKYGIMKRGNTRGCLSAVQVVVGKAVYSGALTVRSASTLRGAEGASLTVSGATVSGAGNLSAEGAVTVEGSAWGTRRLIAASGMLTLGAGNDLASAQLESLAGATATVQAGLAALEVSGVAGTGALDLGDVASLSFTGSYGNAAHGGTIAGGVEGLAVTKRGIASQTLTSLPEGARLTIETGTLELASDAALGAFTLLGGTLETSAGTFTTAYAEMTRGAVALATAGTAAEAKPAMAAANDATVSRFTLAEGGIVRYDTKDDLAKFFPKGFIPYRDTPYRVRLGVDLADELTFPHTFKVMGAAEDAKFEVLCSDGTPAPEGSWGASGSTITINDAGAVVGDVSALPQPKYHWAFDGNLNPAEDSRLKDVTLNAGGAVGEDAFIASENGQALTGAMPYGGPSFGNGNWTMTATFAVRDMLPGSILLSLGRATSTGALLLTRGQGQALTLWHRPADAWVRLMDVPLLGDGASWHFVALTRSARYLKLYVDGALAGETIFEGVVADRDLQVGAPFGNGGPAGVTNWNAAPGAMDDVAIYDSVLQAAQLAQAMAKTAGLWRWHEASDPAALFDPAATDWATAAGALGAFEPNDGTLTAHATLLDADTLDALYGGIAAGGLLYKELRLTGEAVTHRLPATLEPVTLPEGATRLFADNALTLDLRDAEVALTARWLSGETRVKVADGRWVGPVTLRNAPEGFDAVAETTEDGVYVLNDSKPWDWAVAVDLRWDGLSANNLYGPEGYRLEGAKWNESSGNTANGITMNDLRTSEGETLTGSSLGIRTKGGVTYTLRSGYWDLMLKGVAEGPARYTYSGIPAGDYEVLVYFSWSSSSTCSPVKTITAAGSHYHTYVDGELVTTEATEGAAVPAGWGQINYNDQSTTGLGCAIGLNTMRAPVTVGADGLLTVEISDSANPTSGPGLDWQTASGRGMTAGIGLYHLRVQAPVYLRTVSGGEPWAKAGAWTLPDGTVAPVDAPPEGSIAILTAEADAVLTVAHDNLRLKGIRTFGEGTVALRYDASAWMTDADYEAIPASGIDITLLEAEHDPERVRVWLDGLKYGALASVTQTASGATAHLSLPEALYPERGLISVNFWDATNKVAGGGKMDLSGSGTSGYTGYNALLAYWAQNDGATSGTMDLKCVPFAQRVEAGATVTELPGALTWSAYSTWSFNSAKGLLSGFLNDRPLGNTTGKNANLRVKVPENWGKYTAIVYGVVNSGTRKFTPRKVNGAWYTYADGALAKMETPDDPGTGEWTPGDSGLWGDTSVCNDFVEGSNLMMVSGLSGDFLLEWYGTINSSNSMLDRGPVAALQLVQDAVPDLSKSRVFHATVSGETTWGNVAWQDAAGNPKEGTPGAEDIVVLTLSGDATLSCDDVAEGSAADAVVIGTRRVAPFATACLEIRGNGHAVTLRDRPALTVGEWAFLNDATLALSSAEETLPGENVRALPRRLRYDYAHEGAFSTTATYETEFAAGYDGAFTPAGGSVEFSGGKVTFDGMNNSATSTQVLFSGNVQAQAETFSIGTANVTLRDKAAVVATQSLLASDGGAGRTSRLTLEDDATLTVLGTNSDASNAASFLLAHWNGETHVTLRDRAQLVAEKAVMLTALDGRVPTFTVEDEATVRVLGLAVHRDGDPITVDLRGGRLLVGERGLARHQGRKLAFAFSGGAFGAWRDLTLGADAAEAVATVAGDPVFASEGEAELTLSQTAPFAADASKRLIFRAGKARLAMPSGTALPALETAGGTLTLTGTVTTPRLRLHGGRLNLEGGFPVADAIVSDAATVVRVPLVERLSEGGYLALARNGRLPDFGKTVFELALSTERPDTASLLPMAPLALGSYAEGAVPHVAGLSVLNNSNGALSDWEPVFANGDAGTGLYVKLSGNEVLRQTIAELRPDRTYDLPQSTANGWPFVTFRGNGPDSLLGLPEGGLALPHATFAGSGPIRVVAKGTEPHVLLRGVGYTFSADVVFDLSAWQGAFEGILRGAVRGVPASVCLVSGGVVKAPASVRLTADWGEGVALPAGFTGSVEATADGVYYVVRADRRTRTISANFTSAAVPLASPPAVPGAYGVPVAAWNDLASVFSTSALRLSDAGGGFSAPARSEAGVVTQLLAYTSQTGSDPEASAPMLRAWMSDSAAQTVRLTNVPFAHWRLALVFSGDLGGAEWAALTVNGHRYAMDAEGYTRRDVLPYKTSVPGDETWGSTDRTEAAAPTVLGRNALVTDVLSGDATIELPAFVYGRRYAGLAALQLLEAPAPEAVSSETFDFAYTFAEGGAFALADLDLAVGGATGRWVDGPENTLTLTCDHDVTLTLPTGFEAARVVCVGEGRLTLLPEAKHAGVAIGVLNAARLANLTVGFPLLGVPFSPAREVSRFEALFDNAGEPYYIARGATLALGKDCGVTTPYDGVSSPSLTFASESAGTLRRDYPVYQRSAINAPNLTFAFGDASFVNGTDNSNYNWLVEEGDSVRHVGKYHLTSKAGAWAYTQTGGNVVFGNASIDDGGILLYNNSSSTGSSATLSVTGGRLETPMLTAWRGGTQATLRLGGEGTLALGVGGFRVKNADCRMDVTLAEKGTLEATTATLAAVGPGTVRATLEGGRLTTALSSATLTLPLTFEAPAEAPTEVAPAPLSTLLLSAANSGSGALAVTQGTLAVDHGQGLGAAAVAVKNGATFEARGFRGGDGAAFGNGEAWDSALLKQELRQYWALNADRSCTAGSAQCELNGGNYGSVAPSSAAGRFGSGLGDGAGFWVPGAGDLTSFLPGEGDFACAFWLRTDNTIADGFGVANPPDGLPLKGILSRGVVGIDSSTGNRGWGIFVDGEGKVRLDIRKVAGSGSTLAENRLALVSAAPVFGASPAFHHIAWTRSGQTITLYVDGAVSAAGTLPGGFTNIAVDNTVSWRELNVRAPKGTEWVNRHFRPGEGFDELAFWSRALTEAEVSALAKSGAPLGDMLKRNPEAASDPGSAPAVDTGDAVSGTVSFEAGSTCSATTATAVELPYTARIASSIAFPDGKERVVFLLNGELYDGAKVAVDEAAGTVTFGEEAKVVADDVAWATDAATGVWRHGAAGPWRDGKAFLDGAAVTFDAVLEGTTDVAEVTVEGSVRPKTLTFGDGAIEKYRFLQGAEGSRIDGSSLGNALNLGAGLTFDVPIHTASVGLTLSGAEAAVRLVGVPVSGDGKIVSLVGSGNVGGGSQGTHGIWHTEGMGDMVWSPHAGETQRLSPFGTHLRGTGNIVVSGQTAPDGTVSGGTVAFAGHTAGTNWNGSWSGAFKVRDGATLDFAMTRDYSGENGDEQPYFRADKDSPLWENGAVGFELTNGATVRFSGCRGILGGWSQRSRASLIQSQPIVIGKDCRVEYAYRTNSNGQQYTPYGFRMNGDGATLYIGDGATSGKDDAMRGLFMARGASVIVAGVGDPGDPSDPKVDTAVDETGAPVNPDTYGKLTEGITAYIDAENGTGFVRWSNGTGSTSDTGVNLVVGTNSVLRVRSGLDYGAAARSPETPFVKSGAGRALLEFPYVDVKTIVWVDEGALGGATEFTNAESTVTVKAGAGIEAGLSIPVLNLGEEATLFLDPTGGTLLRATRAFFASGGRYRVEVLPGVDADEIPEAAGMAPVKLMAWESAALAGSAIFEPGEALRAKGYGLEVRDDGLYAMRRAVYVRYVADADEPKPEMASVAWYAEDAWFREGAPGARRDYDPDDGEAVTACFVVPDAWVTDGTTVPVSLLLTKEVAFASVRFVAASDFEANGAAGATPLLLSAIYYNYDLSQEAMPGEGETRSFTWVPSLVVETPADSSARSLAYVTVADLAGYTVSVSERTVVVYTAASRAVLNVNFTARSTGDPSWIGSDTEPCGAVPFAGVYWNNASPVDLVTSDGTHSVFSHRATLFGVEADAEGRAPTAEVTYVSKDPRTVASRRGTGNAGLAAGFLVGEVAVLPTALLSAANMDTSNVPSGGWRVRVDAVPFDAYDLYLIMAGATNDAVTYSPVYVKVGDGPWTSYGNVGGWSTVVWRNDLWKGVGGLADDGFAVGSNLIHLRLQAAAGQSLEFMTIDYGNTDATNVGLAAMQIVRVEDGAALNRVGAGKWSDALGWQRLTVEGTVTGAWADATDAEPRAAVIPTVTSLVADVPVSAPYLRMTGSATLSGAAGALDVPSVDMGTMGANAVATFASDVFANPPMVHLAPEIVFSVPEGGRGTETTNAWRWVCDEKRTGTSPASATLHKRGAGDLLLSRKYEGRVRIDDGTLWLSTGVDGAYDRTGAAISGDGVFGKDGAGDMHIYWNDLRTSGASGVLASARGGVLYLDSNSGSLPARQTVEAVGSGTLVIRRNGGNERCSFIRGIIRARDGGRFIMRDATNLFLGSGTENTPDVVLEGGMFQNEGGNGSDYHIYSLISRGNSAVYMSNNGWNTWSRNTFGIRDNGVMRVESGDLAIWSSNHDSNNAINFENKSGGNGPTVEEGATVYSEYPIHPTKANSNRTLLMDGGGTWVQTKRLFCNAIISGGYSPGSAYLRNGFTLRWNLGGDSHITSTSDCITTFHIQSGSRMDGAGRLQRTNVNVESGATLSSGLPQGWKTIDRAHKWYSQVPDRFKGEPSDSIRKLRIDGNLTFKDGAIFEVNLANPNALDVDGTVTFGQTLTVRLTNLPAILTEARKLTDFAKAPVGSPKIACPEAIALGSEVVLRDGNLWLEPGAGGYVWSDRAGTWGEAYWSLDGAAPGKIPYEKDAADDAAPVARVVASGANVALAVDKPGLPTVEEGAFWGNHALVLSADAGRTVTIAQGTTDAEKPNGLTVATSLWKIGAGEAKANVPLRFANFGNTSTLNVNEGTLTVALPFSKESLDTAYPARNTLPAGFAAEIGEGAELRFAFDGSATEEALGFDPRTQTIAGKVTGDGTLAFAPTAANAKLTLTGTTDSNLDYDVRAGTLSLAGNVAASARMARRVATVAAGARLELNAEGALGWTTNRVIRLEAAPENGARVATVSDARVRGAVEVTRVASAAAGEPCVATLGSSRAYVDGGLAFTVPAATTLEVGGVWQTPADASAGALAKRGPGTLRILGEFASNFPMTVAEGAVIVGDGSGLGQLSAMNLNAGATTADWTVAKGARLEFADTLACDLNGGTLTLATGAELWLSMPSSSALRFASAVTFEDGAVVRAGTNGRNAITGMRIGGEVNLRGNVTIDLDALDPVAFSEANTQSSYPILEFERTPQGSGAFVLGGEKLVAWARAGWTLRLSNNQLLLESFGGDDGYYAWEGTAEDVGAANWARTAWVRKGEENRVAWPDANTGDTPAALFADRTHDGEEIPAAARTVDWTLPSQTLAALRVDNDLPGDGDAEASHDYTLTAVGAVSPALTIAGDLLKTGSAALTVRRPVSIGTEGSLRLLGGRTTFANTLASAGGVLSKPVTLAGGATLVFEGTAGWTLSGLIEGDGTGAIAKRNALDADGNPVPGVSGLLTLASDLSNVTALTAADGTLALTAPDQFALAPKVTLGPAATLSQAGAFSVAGDVTMRVNDASSAPQGTFQWAAAAAAGSTRAPRLAAPADGLGAPAVNVAEFRYQPASGHLTLDPGHAVLPASATLSLGGDAESKALWMGARTDDGTTLDYAGLTGQGILGVEPVIDPFADGVWSTNRVLTLRLTPAAEGKATTFRGTLMGALTLDGTPIRAGLALREAEGVTPAEGEASRFVLAGASTDAYLGALDIGPRVRVEANGTWAGNVTVSAEGGVLAGSGTVGAPANAIVVPAGATVTGSAYGLRQTGSGTTNPETIPTTLTVDGTLRMEVGSKLRVLVRKNLVDNNKPWVSCVEARALVVPSIVEGGTANEVKLDIELDIEPGAYASDIKILGWGSISGARLSGVIRQVGTEPVAGYTLRQKADGLYLRRTNARFWMMFR